VARDRTFRLTRPERRPRHRRADLAARRRAVPRRAAPVLPRARDRLERQHGIKAIFVVQPVELGVLE